MINWFEKTAACCGLIAALVAWQPVHGYECQALELARQTDATDVRHERGLLWKIARDGIAPSYLFGTIHVSDPSIIDLPDAVIEALKQSEQFVMEARLDGEDMLAFAQEMFFRDGTRLSELLEPELYRDTEALLARYGIPPMAVESLKPWAAFMTLNMPPEHGLPLDLVLKEKAREHGLSVDGLETVAEQAAVFEALNLETQIDLLRDSVCHYEVLQGDMADMKQLYLERDLEGLFSYHKRYHLQSGERYQNLMQRLLWDRNRTMAERMQPILEQGAAFIAVGAMHLPGDRGVLGFLEQAGYRVTAVY